MKVFSSAAAATALAVVVAYGSGFVAAFSSPKATSLAMMARKTAAAVSSSTALSGSTRREVLTKGMTAGSAVFLANFAGMILVPPSLPANAAYDSVVSTVPTKSKASSYQGVYTDPKHPKGYRVITSTSMTLSDGGGKDAVVYRDLPLRSSKDNYESKTTFLTFDFSAKGGPSNIVGTFEDNGNLDYTIRFPDGNLWTKRIGTVEGLWESSTSGKIRAIYKEHGAGSNLQSVSLQKDGKVGSNPKIFAAKFNKKTGDIQFTDFDDDQEVIGKYSKGIITFPDGHFWTKL